MDNIENWPWDQKGSMRFGKFIHIKTMKSALNEMDTLDAFPVSFWNPSSMLWLVLGRQR